MTVAAILPRLLRREKAASYLDISPSTLEALVKDGALPPPVPWGRGAVRYDRAALDAALDRLQDRAPQTQMETANPWDDLLK